MSDAIGVILARAGSKGVPGKNHRPIAGKPCVAWTIDAARSARLATLCVSTDDPAVAEIARRAGCRVIDRPPELASDTARVDDAARHALAELATIRPFMDPRTPVALLYANVPVRPAGIIERAVAMLVREQCDSVQSYQPVGKYHPWWTAVIDETSGVVAPWPTVDGNTRLNHGCFRRQDLPAAFVPDGAALVCTAAALNLQIAGVESGPHAFFGRDRRGVVSPAGSVVDIDSPIDVIVAEAILSGRVAAS
jgi:CMP-N,N'-diacetyllegionaminic acid synthase